MCFLKSNFNFLKNLQNLKKLKLKLTCNVIARPVFKEPNNQLTHLYLSACKLVISDKTIFNDLKRLKHLDLSEVTLADNVLPELFNGINQLESLALKKTTFKPVQDAFIYLKNLRELNTREMRIPEECSNIFVPLKIIQKLDMSSFGPLNITALGQVKHLRELKLVFFSIEIDKNFLDNHPNLESLDLSILNLSSNAKFNIDLKALSDLKSLKSLKLSNNNLSAKQYNEIFCFENLETLDLSNCYTNVMNRELNLNEKTFERMKNLKVLNLKGNKIKLVGNCFMHSANLRELDLSQTALNSDKNYEIFSSL